MQLRPLFVHLIKELEENQQWENRKKKKSLSLRGDSLFGCAEDDCGQALSAAACVSYPKLPICWLLVSCLEVFPAQRQTSPYHVIPFIPTSKTVSVLVESDFPQSFHSDERERERTCSHHSTHSRQSWPAAVNPALFSQLITGIKYQLHFITLFAPQVYNYKSTVGHTVSITPKNRETDKSQQNNLH